MNLKLSFGIFIGLFLVVVGLPILSATIKQGPISEEKALATILKAHPELAAYQRTSLPPSFIQAKKGQDGWYFAFMQSGSGVPGILHAECYHAKWNKEVAAVGTYTRKDGEIASDIYPDSCAPENVILSEQPKNEIALKLGVTSMVGTVSIRPISVEEDSRCPADVQCVWAGTVKVKAEIVSGMGTRTGIFELEREFPIEAESITLSSVEPAKNSSLIKEDDYVLNFTVENLQ